MGTAVSTPDQGFVFAHSQLTEHRAQSTINSLLNIITDEKIVGIVVGLPLHADGTDSATTAQVRKFADDLAAATDVPIVFIEENLTSVEAAETVGAGLSRHGRENRAPTNIDSQSAKIILENAIAMIKRNQESVKRNQ